MRSKLIGSKEAIENFQFVTINGRVEFEDVERISRIAYYYSKAVKAGVNLALRGVSLNDAVKELYNIIPYAFHAETAYKQALTLVENKGSKVEIKKRWIACKGNKSDKGIEGLSFTFFKTTWSVEIVSSLAYLYFYNF